MKVLGFIAWLIVGGILMYGVSALPPRGELDSPVHRHESLAGTPVASQYYLENAYEDAATPNVVTVILADYRSWDTFGEVAVVFTASMVCFFILRRRRYGA